MSFFGNHITNLTRTEHSDWKENNSGKFSFIQNRPFFEDESGKIHKLDKDFLPDEVALKEDIRVTSVNGMTGDVVIEAGGGDSVIIPDGIYVQENEPAGAEDGALWVDLDEEIEVEQPGVGQFGLGENAEAFNGIDPANASGDYSHAEGRDTIAAGVNSHVQGAYNLKDSENRYAHIVGNGEHGNRSNAHTLDWNGNAWFQGDVFVGGTSQDDADRLVKLSEIGEGFELPAGVPHAVTEDSICEETIEVEAGSGGNYLSFSAPLVEGQLYEIQANGKVYYSKCQKIESDALILGNIIETYSIALGQAGLSPAEMQLFAHVIKMLLSILSTQEQEIELYENIPFGIVIDTNNTNQGGLITSNAGEYEIKISPVTNIYGLDASLLPDIKLPQRIVYDEFILKDVEFETVASETEQYRVAKLSSSELYSDKAAIKTILSNLQLQMFTGSDTIFLEGLCSDFIEDLNRNDAIYIRTPLNVLTSVEGSKLSIDTFICVMAEEYHPFADIDFIMTPGLWIIVDDKEINLLQQIYEGWAVRYAFTTSNKIASSGIIPSSIARVADIPVYYDQLKSCGEERIYAEWEKGADYPVNDEYFILSYTEIPIKQLYGKHYLTIHETEEGTIIRDKVLKKTDFLESIPLYALDELIICDIESWSSLTGLVLLMQMPGIQFPQNPVDESLIYWKIYEPAKQLDDSLLSNNIARKEDLPCYDEIFYYEWNEDTEYETSVDAPANDTYSKMVKISNDAPDSSFFLGKTLSMCYLYDGKENRRDVTLSEELLAEALEGITYSLGDTAIVVMADSFTFDNGVTLTKGIWSMSEYLEDSSMRGLWWKVYDPAKTIEEKYLPDTVVKSSDLQGKTLINPEIASVGQLMMVEEIDESGAPIKWRAVDANSLLNAILPPISEEDNGKTLTVVDGTWQLI